MPLSSYYQGPIRDPFELIQQSDQSEARPPDAPPLTPPNALNPFLIPDGLSYYTRLRYLPYRSFAMQIRLLDPFRRQALQGLWQPRWYSVPQDAGVAIAAGDTLNQRLRVAQGSVLWGYTFAVLPALSGPASTVADLRIQLVDECRNEDLVAQFEIASAFVPNFATGSPSAGFNFVMPSEPIPVNGNGDLLVNIVNTVANDRQCQLLLMMLEPAGSPQ
jgi:hypothetical protein